MAQPVAQAAKTTIRKFRELHGVVVSAGLMDKTVKVRVGGQKWDSFLKKFWDDPKNYLVHDPNNSLRTGDVVAITPGWRVSKHKRHVVKHIIAPGSGVPIDKRPPIPTEEERFAEREAERAAKEKRRAAKKEVQRAEAALGVAERILRRARREFVMRARLMGITVSEASLSAAPSSSSSSSSSSSEQPSSEPSSSSTPPSSEEQ